MIPDQPKDPRPRKSDLRTSGLPDLRTLDKPDFRTIESHPLAHRVPSVPETPGVYLWKAADGQVLYVGKAKQLRRRVASYLQGGRDHPARTTRLVQEAVDLEIIETGSEVEALLLENRLIKELQPRFNVKLKDGRTYPCIAIGRGPFPKVWCTRDTASPDADYIGPFGNATELYRAYHFLQRAFRFRVCDLDLREDDPGRSRFAPCLNWHIKRCSAPCTPRIGEAEYQADIAALRDFLAGRGTRAVVQGLEARMKSCAKDLRFEDAARLRDQLQALGRLKERGRLRDYAEPAAPVLDIARGLTALQQALGLSAPPQVIEGLDNAHLQGRHVVAGLVRFVGGVPDKDGYRRYKIQGEDGQAGNDDFAAMREVVGRRMRRLRDEGGRIPDLLLIDGGHGQLAKAIEACTAEGVAPPCIIGLAKREETIVRPDGSEVQLSRRDPGLKLLQYVRDEAHRFCRRYFHLLQRQALRG